MTPTDKPMNVLDVCSELRITKLSPKKIVAKLRDELRVLARVKITCQAIFKKYFFARSKI